MQVLLRLASGQQDSAKADKELSHKQRLHPVLTLPYVVPGEQAFVSRPCVLLTALGGWWWWGTCLFIANLKMPAAHIFDCTRLPNLPVLKVIYFKMENL